MKRLLMLLTVAVMIMGLSCSCSQSSGLNMDTYRYDGYQSVQWGSEPEQVIYQMGVSDKHIDRLEAERIDKDLPEGTFVYEVTKTTMMFGRFVETRLYFAESLYGMEQYTGLYGMKIIFNEVPEWYTEPENNEEGDESWFRLDPEKVIAEYDKRNVYNRVKEAGLFEDEHGSWKFVSWSCESTLSDLPEAADEAAIEAAVAAVRAELGDEAAEELKNAPLSKFTFCYDNDQDEDPYIYFDGFPASVLYNLG